MQEELNRLDSHSLEVLEFPKTVALAAQKALLEAVVEQAADPIFVVDPTAVITLANSAMRRLYGADLRGQSLVQMSDEFQSPVGTIKRRLHVARKRLAKQLGALAPA